MSDTHRALMSQAARLFEEGPVEAAIAAHHALLEAYPDNPDCWYNLALLERGARRPMASLIALDEALARGISGPEQVWLQRGVVLSDDLSDMEGARTALQHALKLAPRYVPALLNLGNLEEDLGNRAAAESQYRTALAAAPGHPLALARLSGVVDQTGSTDPLLQALRIARDRSKGAPLAEADLGFALGAALDRIGDYDAAFDAYLAANQASRGYAASRGIVYDRIAHEQRIDRLISALPSSQGKQEEHAPLFICGMIRSGSTLAERMLARHPALEAGGELYTIPVIAAGMSGYPEAVRRLSTQECRALAGQYRSEIAHRNIGDRGLIDKRPDNIFHLGLIRAIFPEARIVRTVREPMDNAISAFFLHGDPALSWATDLDDIAHYIEQERRLAAHAKHVLGPAMHELSYERLVAAPRDAMLALLSFCGLDWNEQVLDPVGGRGAVKTASVWQVRQPIHRRSVERWRNYAHRVGDLAEMLGDVA